MKGVPGSQVAEKDTRQNASTEYGYEYLCHVIAYSTDIQQLDSH